jgi:hypothetical protein
MASDGKKPTLLARKPHLGAVIPLTDWAWGITLNPDEPASNRAAWIVGIQKPGDRIQHRLLA